MAGMMSIFIFFRRTAAEDLAQDVPEWARFDVEEVVQLACRVNVNAHGLRDDSGSNLVIGVGLFPLAAMINHSCRPNCTFVYYGETGNLSTYSPPTGLTECSFFRSVVWCWERFSGALFGVFCFWKGGGGGRFACVPAPLLLFSGLL